MYEKEGGVGGGYRLGASFPTIDQHKKLPQSMTRLAFIMLWLLVLFVCVALHGRGILYTQCPITSRGGHEGKPGVLELLR